MTEFPADVIDLGEKIVALTIGKAVQLRDYLKEKYNIEPAGGGVVMAAGPVAAAAPAEKPAEKTEWTVVLEAFDPARKINVIKVVRELTGLGLKEAKDLVDGAPKPVKEKVSKEEAQSIKQKLEENGATVEIR